MLTRSALVAGFTALLTAATGIVPATAVDVGGAARELSRRPVPIDSSWREGVRDDADGVVYPASVEVRGDAEAVDAPGGLQAPGGDVTVIRSSGDASAPTPTLLLDLGRNVGGVVEVGVRASDGTPIRLGYSEARVFARAIGDVTPKPAVITTSFGTDDDPDQRNDVFTPSTGGGDQTLRSPAVRGAQRWIWLQVEGTGTVSIDYVRVVVTNLRPTADDYSGWFHSSDPLLNRVWFASVYTTNLATIRDARASGSSFVYVDGAKRDRLVWVGEAARAAATGFASQRSAPVISRNSVAMFGCQQDPSGLIPPASQIANTCSNGPGEPDGLDAGAAPHDVLYLGNTVTLPEYTGWWVVALHQHWLHTGDDDFVRSHLPVARRALKFFSDRAVGGLFQSNTTGYEITWHVPDPAAGAETRQNISWFRALRAMVDLEALVGDGADAAAAFAAQSESLRAAMLAKLWDPVAGAFLNNDVDPLRNHTLDANAEAVEAGLVTGEQADRVLAYIRDHLHTAHGSITGEIEHDPFMRPHHASNITVAEIGGRFLRGDAQGALDLVRRTYGAMVDGDPGTLWERVGPSGEPFWMGEGTNNFMSFSHPNGAPVAALSAWVLGIRPTSAGYRSWIVAPQPGDLTSAQGQVTTPAGVIASRWERPAGDRSFRLTVEAPARAAGDVAVPLLGRDRVIARDGVVVWADGRSRAGVDAWSDGRAVHFADVTGTRTFAWSAA